MEIVKVCTKNGEWLELTEELIKSRSNYDKDGKPLDSITETPELIKQWIIKLKNYNRAKKAAGIEVEEAPKEAPKRGRPPKEEEKAEDDLPSEKELIKQAKDYIKDKKLKVKVTKDMGIKEISKLIKKAEEKKK
jgi:hypothetical protein